MCYSNCPGENWEGCCIRPSIQNTPEAHCYDDEEDGTDGAGEEKEEIGKGCLPEV